MGLRWPIGVDTFCSDCACMGPSPVSGSNENECWETPAHMCPNGPQANSGRTAILESCTDKPVIVKLTKNE